MDEPVRNPNKLPEAAGSESSARLDAGMDPFYQHEALDRCHIINCTISDHLLDHPFVHAHPEVQKLVAEASLKLGNAYQAIGQYDLK